jgi:GT2 family glycosyltransferase
MSPPVCSIVIPVFNRAELTRACLDALRDTVDFSAHELIVVDNASTDDTAALLAGHPLAPRTIRNDRNLGFAGACNQGAEAARGELLVFLNNDTIPEPGWLAPLIEIARREPGVAAVGCRLLYPDSRLIQHAGVAFDLPGPIPYHMWRGFPADWPPANVPRDLDVVTAACVLMRRDVFRSLDGFDESYRNGYEDVDLCLRMREKGHRVAYCPTSVVLHHEGMSEGRMAHDGPNAELYLQRWADRLRDRTTPRRELIAAALDELFRINASGGKWVGILDGRLIHQWGMAPPIVHVFRNRFDRALTVMWLRLRHFGRWRSARRIKADLVRAGRQHNW